MNSLTSCQDVCVMLGFGCEQLEADGGAILALDTPFGFSDGTPFVIYTEQVNGYIRFFDSGETLFHSMGRGIRSFDSRKYQGVNAVVKRPGVYVTETGEIEGFFAVDKTAFGFAAYISALLGVAAWEDENAGVDLASKESKLIEETRLYLAAMNPKTPVQKSSLRAKGLSGKEYGFHLTQGETQIDAISAHPNAASTELYKLVDLRGRPMTAGIDIIVVVDDRASPKQADQEVSVLGQYAKAWPMRKLIHAAAAATPARH